jgi:hypothetical protein
LTEWRDETYQQVFDQTCESLEAGLRDNVLSRGDLERLLQAAYTDQGNDWLGRGSLHDTVQSATIAAYEHVLAQLSAGDKPQSPSDP